MQQYRAQAYTLAHKCLGSASVSVIDRKKDNTTHLTKRTQSVMTVASLGFELFASVQVYILSLFTTV